MTILYNLEDIPPSKDRYKWQTFLECAFIKIPLRYLLLRFNKDLIQ